MTRRWMAWGLIGLVVAAVCAYAGYERTHHAATDWVVFEVGARSLVHYHHESAYAGSSFHVYVENAGIQIGPPALWAVAGFQWLTLRSAGILFVGIIAALGVIGVAAAAQAGAARRVREASSRGSSYALLAAGLVVIGLWCFEGGRARHIDDAIALSFAGVAAMLVARHQHLWFAGVLLGTGIAAKPWAIILLPILLALPRRDLPRTTLITIGVAAAWWAPFVIAAPDTIQALGHWQILPRPGSVLYLVGIHGYVQHWLRPVQFVLGLGAGAYACWRRPWVSAPLAAMAMRVVTDPFEFGYYGIGPLLVAYIYDCSEQRFGGYPVMTAVTAVLEFGLPEIVGFDSSTAAVAKIAWAVIALAVALRPLPAQASSARSSHGDEWARGLPSTP